MFRDQSLDQFLAELSSRAPTPGGGSAAGLAAAMGVALVEMVANVVSARDESEKARLEEFIAVSETMRSGFLELMEQDSSAFEAYMAAMKLPKETDEEKALRRSAMQTALKSSAVVPMNLAEKVCEFAEVSNATFSSAPKDIASDLYVGSAMLEAAYQGAIANVYVNLAYIKDPVFVNEVRASVDALTHRVGVLTSFKETVGRLLEIP
ncbi:MAG: cyclodeaminase/cyclohydrolase family protein [Candidatus Cryosericum sp.]